jgi:hypothetical protein
VIVVGSRNSSNSVRLVEVALEAGATASYRVDNAGEIDEAWLDGVDSVGVTSGASVPDELVQGVLDFLVARGFPAATEERLTEENLVFALPPELRKDIAAHAGHPCHGWTRPCPGCQAGWGRIIERSGVYGEERGCPRTGGDRGRGAA